MDMKLPSTLKHLCDLVQNHQCLEQFYNYLSIYYIHMLLFIMDLSSHFFK